MKLFITLLAITLIKYHSCAEKKCEDLQHYYKCRVLIEQVFDEVCTIQIGENAMGFVMQSLQKDNDSLVGIEYCRLFSEGADCVLNNLFTKVTDDCKSLDEYQSKLVVAQYDKTYSMYYCANDMQHLRDRSELDGIDCLYGHAFYQCRRTRGRIQTTDFSSKDELCRDNYLNIKCSEQWATCQNQKVKDIQLGLFDVLHQGMECPPINFI